MSRCWRIFLIDKWSGCPCRRVWPDLGRLLGSLILIVPSGVVVLGMAWDQLVNGLHEWIGKAIEVSVTKFTFDTVKELLGLRIFTQDSLDIGPIATVEVIPSLEGVKPLSFVEFKPFLEVHVVIYQAAVIFLSKPKFLKKYLSGRVGIDLDDENTSRREL